jgi:hypothetical protein
VGAAFGDSAGESPGSRRAGKNKKGDRERRGGKLRLLFPFLPSFPLSVASLIRETPTYSSRWRQRIPLVCEKSIKCLI